MTTEQYSIGYEAGYQDGFDAALSEPVKQEPVATVNANDEGYWADILPDRDVKVGQLLYAAPVSTKREWVELPVLDLDAIIEKHYDDEMDLKAMILDGIAAFKEKNK